MAELTIKQMVEQSGVSADTLRYYERIGLIDPVMRAENGHRRYQDRDLLRVSFLRRLKATGMSISDMLYYVNLYRQGDSTLVERREILQAHKQVVLGQIDELYETVDFIDMKIERYIAEEEALTVKETN